MGLHRELFSQRVLAEMMGPITIDGHNPFWDYCTRCFINLSYEQADRFCQQTKEFLLTLFPREEIYLTLINPEARSVVGTVGPETMPAKRMLENLGFKYHNRIDPFDGGPHLEAQIENITVVRDTDRSDLAAPVKPDETAHLSEHGIVSVMTEDGDFRAVECDFARDRTGRIIIDTDHMSALQAEPGTEVGFTPLARPDTWPLRTGVAAAKNPLRTAGKPTPKPVAKAPAKSNGVALHVAKSKGGKAAAKSAAKPDSRKSSRN
jgi:arginine N-succinyltransferase